MNVLMVGDIVASPGRKAFAQVVARLKAQGEADFVVANAENAAGGRGITGTVAEELFAAGADVLTLGDHTWDQKELVPYLTAGRRIVRPANFAPGCPGQGWIRLETGWGPVGVMALVGRVFMKPEDCPFRTATAILEKELRGVGIILVDMHAEATSEKICIGRYLDGKVSAVVGTHTHVQTSDETVLPGGTAYITDLGMTGPKDSVLGRDLRSVLSAFLTGMPAKFEIATDAVTLEGVVIEVNRQTGKAAAIRRVRERI